MSDEDYLEDEWYDDGDDYFYAPTLRPMRWRKARHWSIRSWWLRYA